MYRFFSNHYDVRVYDSNSELSREVPLSTKDQINECELAVICVPTPSAADGACDLSLVQDTLKWLKTSLVLLKSTVPPGTTDELRRESGKRIVFSPEYCGESSYWTPYAFHTDIKETPFFTFGGEPRDTSAMIDWFLPVVGPVKQYRQTTALAAETAKYMENSFYALKITFCYEFAMVCKALGVDFNEVRELWLLDPRINPMHTAVFAENIRPFSGKCLPKDLAAIVKRAQEAGYSPELLNEVINSCDRIAKLRENTKAPAKAKLKKAA